MSPIIATLFLVLGVLAAPATYALGVDGRLTLVKQVYGLQPKDCGFGNEAATAPRVPAGKVLFNSTALSGNRDIACASCHLDEFGSADGLPIAVGVGAEGEGSARMTGGKGVLVQRNALPLLGRGSPLFTAFFWDGKVQVADGRIITQFGEHTFGQFDSALAAAAVLPLIERDEFLGETHALGANDVQRAVGDSLYYHRYEAVSAALRARFTDPKHPPDEEVAAALRAASVEVETLELSDLGNLLAAFIRDRFPCETSRWDRYLAGEPAALSEIEKRGAVLFYGNARCAACHSGTLLSDFDYHSIGAPQGSFGPHTRHRDIGRAAVTNRADDLYKFRTPPLISVSRTAPYGHNGIFPTLKSVVVHHFNPLAFYRAQDEAFLVDYYRIGKLLASRDSVLSTIDVHSADEVAALLAFLRAL